MSILIGILIFVIVMIIYLIIMIRYGHFWLDLIFGVAALALFVLATFTGEGLPWRVYLLAMGIWNLYDAWKEYNKRNKKRRRAKRAVGEKTKAILAALVENMKGMKPVPHGT